MTLNGRVALVTGGGGRIGNAICDALAELGAIVAVLDVDEAEASNTAKRIGEAYGVQSLPITVDLTDDDAVRRVPESLLERFARLDILINCAALVGTSDLDGWAAPFQEQTTGTWRRALDVNLTAPFVLSQACALPLAQSGQGSMINISSIYGISGPDQRIYGGTSLGNPAAYAASKGGLLQLTRWLATTLAPDVRVNAITLGGVERDQPAKFQEAYIQKTPLRRMAIEEDVKGAVAYLASDMSAYVTGHNLVVDGGWTTW